MKTTKRFEEAVRKLYTAFHNGTLDAMDCQHCAVGNICDNKKEWQNERGFYVGGYALNTLEEINRAKELIKKTGYSRKELVEIEKLFMQACEYDKGSKELQFKGLCAVIKYLAELDGIDNPMDYSKLFETENNKPKYDFTL